MRYFLQRCGIFQSGYGTFQMLWVSDYGFSVDIPFLFRIFFVFLLKESKLHVLSPTRPMM